MKWTWIRRAGLFITLLLLSAWCAAAAALSFTVFPVGEESIRTLYGWEGKTVAAITPYEGDFLVEYRPAGWGTGETLLEWVFGETGRRVQLTGAEEFSSYEITGPGQVAYTTTGADTNVPWKWLPETCQVQVLGDAQGRLDKNGLETNITASATWLDPAEPLYTGFWDGGPAPGDRFFQLYDARMDADGLSLSFVPSGDSLEKFRSFFPACTTVPCMDTRFDPATRTLTLRLYNTSLSSGGIPREELEDWIGEAFYQDLYPYEFPAGSLGRDSHFLRNAEVHADGEDTVITAVLTQYSYRLTVEQSNLGFDNIPCLRLRFREEHHDLDG
ncbi:hypothetical protein [Pseudoflavonifractor sp. 524-17]|uniref:hypothetical protein n=1 Tax=Pseudoflavonifractor sp. 524-17 TaxID=2304577 RepID=UPI001FACDE2D|nr:hypothetical protein [Pseudoflavonifractor sp. 524-17]